MRVPLTWLREYCDPDLDAAGIADRLDLTGTELERIEHVGVGDTSGFVVGKVLSAEQHPDADRLKVCEVDDGHGQRTIVCGAPNVAAGQTVAVALPGAVMPDGADARRGQAARREVQRDDPGRGRGGHRRRPRRDHGAGRRVARRGASGGAPAAGRRRAGAGDHAQPARLPVGVRHRPRGARRHRRGAVRRPHRGRCHRLRRTTPRPTTCRSRSPTPRSACASPAACSRT